MASSSFGPALPSRDFPLLMLFFCVWRALPASNNFLPLLLHRSTDPLYSPRQKQFFMVGHSNFFPLFYDHTERTEWQNETFGIMNSTRASRMCCEKQTKLLAQIYDRRLSFFALMGVLASRWMQYMTLRGWQAYRCAFIKLLAAKSGSSIMFCFKVVGEFGSGRKSDRGGRDNEISSIFFH